MSTRVLFIDRDGTLIEEPPDNQVDALRKIRLLPGVIPALIELARYGYRFVMVSNQDGLGTASFPEEDFRLCHEHVLALFSSQGIEFDEIERRRIQQRYEFGRHNDLYTFGTEPDIVLGRLVESHAVIDAAVRPLLRSQAQRHTRGAALLGRNPDLLSRLRSHLEHLNFLLIRNAQLRSSRHSRTNLTNLCAHGCDRVSRRWA